MNTSTVVLDNVFDASTVDSILNHIDDSTSNVKWYNLMDKHIHIDLCLNLLEISNRCYEMSSCVGYEFCTRLSSNENIIRYPLCSIIYYPHVRDLKGGRLLLEDDIITPKSNRLVLFAPSRYRNVEEFTGERIEVVVNPFSKYS